jgi:hypothetical protein
MVRKSSCALFRVDVSPANCQINTARSSTVANCRAGVTHAGMLGITPPEGRTRGPYLFLFRVPSGPPIHRRHCLTSIPARLAAHFQEQFGSLSKQALDRIALRAMGEPGQHLLALAREGRPLRIDEPFPPAHR